jgi:hypothetical protein
VSDWGPKLPKDQTKDQKGVMRPGPNKRSRGRNNGNHPPHNRPRTPYRVQTFDSNGPNVKIRGNAYQIFERYVALAREALAGGDRIGAENLYQHAEHYFRVMNANGDGNPHGPRPTTPADLDVAETEERREDETLVQPLLPLPSRDDQPQGF